MPKQRQHLSFFIGLAALCVSQGAPAIGWGRAPQSAVLGQPLDFNVSLRLDPGDVVAPECVQADVTVGDQRLNAAAVRLGVDTSQADSVRVRVLTRPAIEEPVVAVNVAIGCPTRMSRRFVLLADPPSAAAPAAPPPVPELRVAAATDTARPAATELARPVERPTRTTPPAEPRRAANRAPAPPRKTRKVAAPPPAVVAQPADAAPRLRLDAAETPPVVPSPSSAAVDEAFRAVAQAASAARAAASAASEAQARVGALETQVAQLRAEAERNREQAAALRARMADGEAAARSTWLPWLAVLALGVLSGWLGWRLRAAQQERDRAWRQAAAVAEPPRPPTAASQLPMVTSEIMVPPLPPAPPYPRRGAHVPAAAGFATTLAQPAPPSAADPLPAAPAVERTDIIAHGSDNGSPRDVSIEELLDLEQQAEFFIVLGQEEAAIDLLVDHLRDTGGGSPLPYLKLLEIYHRRGDREAYERTRARFNHRFNAYAPDWDIDLQNGRSLDDYAGVVPRLQQVWPRPLDAMAELEALLFRKSRGELFDLPAYREVLFLYSLARDLLDREAVDTGNVDLLLPLADGGEFSATSPHPYFGLERDLVFETYAAHEAHEAHEDRPTAPVDLDLTQPDEEPVIVKPLAPRV